MKLDSLDLFFGDANPAEARVYARCRSECGRLAGYLSGPQCAFAQTLAAKIPFTARGGSVALAEAVIPDPCFWTPELPFLYRAHLEFDGARGERMIGIRRLGARGRQLVFDGKRFVLRAVRTQAFETAAAYARETWTALVVDRPSDELCEFASRQGVLLVADLSGATEDIAVELRRMAQWPAVCIALLAAGAELPTNIRETIPNLLLAQLITAGQPFELKAWAQLAFVATTDLSKLADIIAPIIVMREQPGAATVEQLRAACDTLQSELAPHDFAGYMV